MHERSAAALVVRWIMPSEDDEQRQTCEVNPDIERLKRAVFGDKAELARVETIGSGVSEFTRITLPVLAAPELVNRPTPPPWAEYCAMIARQIEPILGQARTCPGMMHPACCHAEPGRACFPNWREHEDPPWYALQINILLSLVNQRIAGRSTLAPGLAAENAFELGCLYIEASIKFRWDEHAKRGEKVVTGARRGGDEQRSARLGRLTTEQTVAAVKALLAVGTRRMAAYSIVAEQQGVTLQTIAKEFQRHQK